MLANIVNDPELGRFLRDFAPGEVIFFEDEESQDLYLLAEGQVEVLKGQVTISQVSQPGAVFGEMSFLLGAKRTATVRALGQTKVLRIPPDQIEPLARRYPELSLEMTKLLAQRLDHTSQALHGLQELCDLLADAVIFTDDKGRVLAHNRAAQDLYGRCWSANAGMECSEQEEPLPESAEHDAAAMFAEPQAFKALLEQVRAKKQIRESLLQVKHPLRGALWVSASLTALYDPRHAFQGVLVLARDVTSTQNLHRRMRRIRTWLLPAVFLLAGLAGGLAFWQPHLFTNAQALDSRQQSLRNQLARDYLLLQDQLEQVMARGQRDKALAVLAGFLAGQDKQAQPPFLGLVLLDKAKEVLGGLTLDGQPLTRHELGATYAHIRFQGDEKSVHRLLSLYRQDKAHPQGRRDLELAFELMNGQELVGWLVFQLDPQTLKKRFDLDEEGLKALRFP